MAKLIPGCTKNGVSAKKKKKKKKEKEDVINLLYLSW